MSIARAFNAAVAIIEGRPKDAREMLREEPLSEGMGTIYTRLQASVTKAQCRAVLKELNALLMNTLRLEPNVPGSINPDVAREAYYEGVRAVETLIEELVDEYEWTYGSHERENS